MTEGDTIHSILKAMAAQYGAKAALRFFDAVELDHGDIVPQTVSYIDLLARVTGLANAFRALADDDAPVISLLIPSTIDGVTALLAAEIAGRAHPINHFLDPAAIHDAMIDAGTQIVVGMGPHPTLPVWTRLQAAIANVPALLAVIVTDRARGIDGATAVRELVGSYPRDELVGPAPRPDAVAALFNTAGTTGRSKIVPLSHANLLAAAKSLAAAWDFSPSTRIVNALPFFHVAGANLLLQGPLTRGAEILLLSESGLRNPQILARHWEIVERCRPTIVGGIPSSLIALLDVPLNGADISSVRFCATGGAPMPAIAARRFHNQFGLPIHTIYGMTETAGLIATAPVGHPPDYDSVGPAVPEAEVQVRKLGESGPGAVLDTGEGIVCVRGPQVFQGYLGQSQNIGTVLTGGWIATGDIGQVASGGQLTISGRCKDIIIRSGNNIDPAVIETAANSFPGVAEAAAVAMPDRYAGEVPVLFVVARDDSRIAEAALSDYLRSALSDPHERPSRIFVIPKLPLTSVGKLSRIELRRQAAATALSAELAELGDDLDVRVNIGADGRLDVRLLSSSKPDLVQPVIESLGLRLVHEST